jgi:hypothetical protein
LEAYGALRIVEKSDRLSFLINTGVIEQRAEKGVGARRILNENPKFYWRASGRVINWLS